MHGGPLVLHPRRGNYYTKVRIEKKKSESTHTILYGRMTLWPYGLDDSK